MSEASPNFEQPQETPELTPNEEELLSRREMIKKTAVASAAVVATAASAYLGLSEKMSDSFEPISINTPEFFEHLKNKNLITVTEMALSNHTGMGIVDCVMIGVAKNTTDVNGFNPALYMKWAYPNCTWDNSETKEISNQTVYFFDKIINNDRKD